MQAVAQLWSPTQVTQVCCQQVPPMQMVTTLVPPAIPSNVGPSRFRKVTFLIPSVLVFFKVRLLRSRNDRYRYA
jgi:hypothetical protein